MPPFLEPPTLGLLLASLRDAAGLVLLTGFTAMLVLSAWAWTL